jgi:hypothetical protein
MMRRTILFLTLIIFATLQAKIILGQSVKPMPDGMPIYQEFEARIKEYPYIAPSERSVKILAGLPKLKRCMNKASIEALLGVPDYSDINYGPKGPGEHWLGSSWTYYLSKRSTLVNENDPCIQIFFDTDGHAQWIVPRNVKDAYEIGRVGEKCT